MPPQGNYSWVNLSTNANYPANACSISLVDHGNDSYVKVLTTTGEVWETHGDTNGTNFIWTDPWVKVVAQPS
ncbi:hypothetical protein ACIRP2_33460 [Streptomyces sp. NPDC101194]|uniref:hypothetical protein n=1 Tax=Streptomyces sp. NPDC101194 TaxID=3366127 RepID=UPI00381A4646